MDGLSRHLQQMEGKLLEGEMFTPASLEISNEEWNQLVHAGTNRAPTGGVIYKKMFLKIWAEACNFVTKRDSDVDLFV